MRHFQTPRWCRCRRITLLQSRRLCLLVTVSWLFTSKISPNFASRSFKFHLACTNESVRLSLRCQACRALLSWDWQQLNLDRLGITLMVSLLSEPLHCTLTKDLEFEILGNGIILAVVWKMRSRIQSVALPTIFVGRTQARWHEQLRRELPMARVID